MLKDLAPEDIDNEYILTGYRVRFKGVRKVFSTMFMMHNETFNIWSHFLGQLFYLGIAIAILVSFPDMNDVGIDALIQK
jgi:adiponectin receptor